MYVKLHIYSDMRGFIGKVTLFFLTKTIVNNVLCLKKQDLRNLVSSLIITDAVIKNRLIKREKEHVKKYYFFLFITNAYV